ncbi:hypothetical protein [Liquorilactobacillus cacaonum]|uniref:Lipoprotein n=1 Tax=Liquorilactobacillus cacaonum DSM 21116 TaxID=1423729 RepID=A0A0R2CMX2_9LACO|nr:hypothetical protein [Liquorilactobacillus cacaonum]KRM92941.1 lipoprotein [Liquorilactobacillus cacaonum DSM 21116]
MKARVRKIFLGITLTLLTIMIVGCSSENNGQSSDSSMSTQQVKSHYADALEYLDKGASRQAYRELGEIIKSKSATKKIKDLYDNLGNLLTAKRAVTESNLSLANEKLQKLSEIKSPDKLVEQITAVQKEYQAVKLAKIYYDETLAYYNAGKYSEAGGSLQVLMALSNKYQAVASYQEKVKGYQQKIATAQNQSQAAETSSANYKASSGYTNARSSKIVSSTYASQTGNSISSATNSQVSSVVAEVTNDQVLTKFRAVTGIPQEAGDQYYVTKIDDSTYQIEIRHTSPDNVNVSNLKGMYKYNYSTGKVQKADEITGEYVNIN